MNVKNSLIYPDSLSSNFISPMDIKETFPSYGDIISIQNKSSQSTRLYISYKKYTELVNEEPIDLVPNQFFKFTVARNTISIVIKEFVNQQIQNTILLFKTEDDRILYIPLGPVYTDLSIQFRYKTN